MGARYREYLQGQGGATAKKDQAVSFEITGIDETIRVFEQIRDKAMQDRKVVMIIRRVVRRYYLPIIKGLALTMGPKVRGNKFAESFGLLETLSKSYINKRTKLVGVRAGARVATKYKGKSFFPQTRGQRRRGGKSNYGGGGWLAAMFEYGTDERKKKHSGASTGKIRPTKFATIAFKRAKHIVERMLREKLKTMMEKEFAYASRGQVRKIPRV